MFAMGELLSKSPDNFAFGEGLGSTTKDFTLHDDGTAAIEDYPVFRTGKFADSKGRVQEWTTEDLTSMVQNFSDMREEFPNPVVREDHSRTMDSVVGYVDGLSVSDDKNTLLANFTLTEARAVERWTRKTYRGRSSEIGAWRVSDEDVRHPFYMGFAFVDIPAVTRLFGSAEAEPNLYMMEAEVPKTVETPEPEGGLVPELHKFSVMGAEVTDYAAVQTHITELETFAADQRSQARTDFVMKLITENRLAAPAKDDTLAFAASMSDDQFAQWSKIAEAGEPLAVFGTIGTTGTDSTADGVRKEKEQQLADAQAVVAHFTRSGASDEKIHAMESYKTMQALKEELA